MYTIKISNGTDELIAREPAGDDMMEAMRLYAEACDSMPDRFRIDLVDNRTDNILYSHHWGK